MVDQRVDQRQPHADAGRQADIGDKNVNQPEDRRMVYKALPNGGVADEDAALDHILGQKQRKRRGREQHQHIMEQQLGRGRFFARAQHKRQAGQDAERLLAFRPVVDRALAQQVHRRIKQRQRQRDIQHITQNFLKLCLFFTLRVHDNRSPF